MEISLHNTGKRYRYDWIFRRLDYQFSSGNAYAVTGPNGAGKSTLLRVLSGFLTPSEGTVSFKEAAGKLIETDLVHRSVSYAAPYIELIEEFTLQEAIRFQGRFKNYQPGLSEAGLLDILSLPKATHQPLKYFSSGMKQRLKLLLAICADTPVVLLDEPTTNLDHTGMDWYLSLMEKYAADRLVVVASNIEADYVFCRERVDIMGYK